MTAKSHSSTDTMNRSDGDTADVQGQEDSVEVQGGAGGDGLVATTARQTTSAASHVDSH